MKRYIAVLLIMVLLLSGCAANSDGQPLEGVAPQPGTVGGESEAGDTDSPTTQAPDVDTPTNDTPTTETPDNNPTPDNTPSGDTPVSNTPTTDNKQYDIRFDYNTDYHDASYIASVVDPNFKVRKYGATGLSGAGIPVSCLSFNVLSHHSGDKSHKAPELRAPAVIQFLKDTNADLVGLQEVTNAYDYNWVKAVKDGISNIYDIRMLTDEDDCGMNDMKISAGLMILYRKDRFTLLDSGCQQFWDDDNRYFQWVKLKDNKSGREIMFTNTHYSINSGDAVTGNKKRCGEAVELLEFWQKNVKDTALFATGDYNCKIPADPHAQIMQKSIYQPSCLVKTQGDSDSWLDFCYVNTKCMDVKNYDFMEREYAAPGGQTLLMSDHYPVLTYAVYK